MAEDSKEELFELRSQHQLLENRMKAMINILSREGVLTHADVEDELDRIVQGENEK